ncbi:MAG: lipid A-modifier LpxR family protein [Pseudomonadota bacterium]
MLHILRIIWIAWLGWFFAAGVSFAWEYQGSARMLTNDFFADRKDRWRSGSYQAGFLWTAPTTARWVPEFLEFRLGAQVITPANLQNPEPDDRPLAGAIALGVHGHWEANGLDQSLGLDLVGIGPSTGLDDLLKAIHPKDQEPSKSVIADQIGDTLRPTLSFAVGRELPLRAVTFYPFVQGQLGAETLLRAGADVFWGPGWASAFPIRDEVTGFAMPWGRWDRSGLGIVLGADAAFVSDSVYLPSSRDYDLTEARLRARAGAVWRTKNVSLFYGATWLGEEFDAQPSPQVVGSINLSIRF